MLFLTRFGVAFWVIFRLIFLFNRLGAGFSGKPAQEGHQAFEYKIRRTRGGGVASVLLGIDAPDTFRFLLRREQWIDRLGKQLGVAEEFQTGDPDFDTRTYIVSDDQTLLNALTADGELRQRVSKLLSHPDVKVLRCSKGMLWFEGDPSSIYGSLREGPEVADAVGRVFVPLLSAVNERLKQINAAGWEDARDPNALNEQLFYIFAFAVGVGGFLTLLTQSDIAVPHALLYMGAQKLATVVALSGLIALWAGATFLLRHSSRLHLVLIELLLTAVPGVWLISRWWFVDQNMAGDTHPRQVYVAEIDRHYMTRGRRSSDKYYVGVKHWPDPRLEHTLQVDRSFYEQTHTGDCVTMGYHEGRFSDPWIDSLEPAPSCAATQPPPP